MDGRSCQVGILVNFLVAVPQHLTKSRLGKEEFILKNFKEFIYSLRRYGPSWWGRRGYRRIHIGGRVWLQLLFSSYLSGSGSRDKAWAGTWLLTSGPPPHQLTSSSYAPSPEDITTPETPPAGSSYSNVWTCGNGNTLYPNCSRWVGISSAFVRCPGCSVPSCFSETSGSCLWLDHSFQNGPILGLSLYRRNNNGFHLIAFTFSFNRYYPVSPMSWPSFWVTSGDVTAKTTEVTLVSSENYKLTSVLEVWVEGEKL